MAGTEAGAGLIEFVCVARGHVGRNGGTSDHLTIHDRKWAFCPKDARESAHDWRPIDGVSVGELQSVVRQMRERAAAEG
jgi:hypothetical protein